VSAPCPTFGFHLSFTIVAAEAEAVGAAVRASFLEHVGALGLVAEGASGDRFEFVITGDGTQATDSDRQRLIAWLDGQREIASHRAGPLTDLTERV
jgi:uncharacterized protein YggL (DUF469 family)